MLTSRTMTIVYFVILAGSLFLPIGFSDLVSLWVLSTIIFVGTSAWGASRINSQYYSRTYCKSHSRHKVAITFDDGPDSANTPLLLNLLAEFNAKATFFIIGSKIDDNRELVDRMHLEGHLVGNHSYTHSNLFPLFPVHKIIKEIRETQLKIQQITGMENLIFRPPFGVTNPLISKALSKFSLQIIGWSLRSLDTRISDKQKVLNRILPRIKGGDVILLHDVTPDIVWIVRHLLEFLVKNRLSPVTITDLRLSEGEAHPDSDKK